MFARSALCLASGINRIAILGGGLMGSGIATVCAAGGKKVRLMDIDEERCKAAKKGFQKAIEWVDKKPAGFMRRGVTLEDAITDVEITTDTAKALEGADLVIEAVPENIALKNKIFKEADSKCPPNVIFATNTSSLSVTEISRATSRSKRFGGLHFFSPVHRMQLLEIVKGDDTDPAVAQQLKEFATEIGKTPVMCKDTPGFAVNRLLVPLMLEALRMSERGDCEFKDIDNAMRLGAGHPMGPFTLADMVGLDVIKFIVDGWHKKYPENPLFNPCPSLDKLVAAGKLGMKTKEGFYKY